MDQMSPAHNPDALIQDLIAELAKGFTQTGEGFNTEAIKKLAAIGTEAIAPLLAAVKEGTPWARANAAMALGSIGDGRTEVVDALSKAWLDQNKIVSIAGRLVLSRLPHPTEPELMNRVHQKVSSRLREVIQEVCRDTM